MAVLDRVGWVLFLGLAPLLWASGAWLFVRSPLPRGKKICWTLFLIAIGLAVGAFLPLPGIRNRFFVLLLLLPALALIDIRLARSNRTFSFWVRACAFEVSTVFGCAAAFRLLLGG